MRALQQIHFSSGKPGHNWRPTQPLNGRKILFRPTAIPENMSGGATLKPIVEMFLSICLCWILS